MLQLNIGLVKIKCHKNMSLKRIGILTSGGDCSGLNSIIRSAYLRSKNLGYQLIGIKRGLRGLSSTESNYVVLNDDICDETMLTTSGSVIYSDTKWMSTTINSGKTIEDVKKSIYEGYEKLGLSGLIYVGGDGSLCLMNELLTDNPKLKIVAVPKTIDNDVGHTDFAVGFQTVVEVACNAIENIRSTAKSHERAMVVEVMGRDAGYIAMYSGIASGADSILVPEFEYDIEKLKNKVKECYDAGRNHSIIIVAEAVEAKDFKHSEEFVDGVVKYSHLKYKGIGNHIADQLKSSGFDSRAVTLGHIQRGGKTAINDRIVASAFGVEAVNLLDSGDCGKLLCYVGGKIENVAIKDIVTSVSKKLDKNDICVKVAKDLGVYIGEI